MTPFPTTHSMSRMLIVGLILVATALAPVVPAEASAGSTGSQRSAGLAGLAGPVGSGNLVNGGPALKFTVCVVIDADNIGNFRFSSLAAAVAQAAPGDTLLVFGTCVGSTTIDRNLTVEGVWSFFLGTPTLQGSSGQQPSGVLTVASGASVAIDGLTIQGGDTTVQGGGIDNHGALTLTSSRVTDNVSGQVGGGIINYGALTLDGSTVRDNVAGNGATSGNGGGIENLGSVTLNGSSSIDGNSASFGGGVDSTFAQTATLTLNDSSSIDANSAHQGGGIENFVFGVGASATVTLNGTSSIAGNTAGTTLGGEGAGIANGANGGATASVTLDGNSTIDANHATASLGLGGLGGGIYNTAQSASSTAAVSCPSATASITGNDADVTGGGIFESGGSVAPNCTAIVTANSPNDIS